MLDEALDSASSRAAEKADATRKPVLTSVGVPLPDVDPLALLASEPDPICGWWAQPGFEAAGAGIAVTHESRGPTRLAELGAALASSFSESVFEGRPPIAFAGASFAAVDSSSAWGEFPQASGWIPETCVIRDSEGSWLVVATMVNPGEPETAAREHLAALFGQAGSVIGRSRVEWTQSLDEGILLPQDQDWDQSVDDALVAIDAGGLQKVVLARKLSRRGAPPSAWRLAAELSAANPTAYRYGIRRGETVFLGASPELLVQRDGDKVQALPAAGTVASDAANDSELSEDKSLREHEFVAAAVADTLRSWCDDVRRSEPRVIEAGPVRHLATDIEARLSRPAHVLDLAGALHPTPAVCGVPLHRASEFIRSHEGFDRGWYAGPIGVVHADGSGTIAVALRCALLTHEAIDCFAGAGIVAGSQASKERDEVGLKMQAVLAAIEASGATG